MTGINGYREKGWKMMGDAEKYTLLIVDDEPVVSDGLKELFEEEFEGRFRVYNCYHPQKALDLFRYRLPDIVVSDIKMPRMTGIEMAEKMREIKPDLHVLFLSGYDEFDYVYSAIRQEADDYILKTEGDGVIVAALRKMLQNLEAESRFKEEYIHVQSKVNMMEPVFKQQALIQILDGTVLRQEDFDSLMSDLEEPVDSDCGLLLLTGRIERRLPVTEQERILAAVEQLLLKDYGDRLQTVHKVMYHGSFVWILETREAGIVRSLFVSALSMQSMIEKQTGALMSFCIAQEPVLWKEVCGTYKSVISSLHRMEEAGSSILIENDMTMGTGSFNGEEEEFLQLLQPMHERIILMERWLNADNFTDYLDLQREVLKILAKARRHSMYALELYYSIAHILVAYINRTNIRGELAERFRLMELFDPGSFENWGKGADYLERLSMEIEKVRGISSQNAAAGINEKTKAYIVTHLSEDLSLTAIGQAAGFNPVYLSRVFKEIEKISIRDYIEKCRMEQAMQLVCNSNMKVYEIAERCGYTNTAYFIKVFRNYYSKTPQECRSGNSREMQPDAAP